jgi:DNA polymerase-3 subunit alpha
LLLNCHTYYSFCYGTFSADELIAEVRAKGYDTFVLTDINNTSACLDTIRKLKEQDIRVVAGIDFRNGNEQKFVGIAHNNEGFRELNVFLSKHLHSAEPFDEVAPPFDHAWIIYPMQAYKGWKLRDNEMIGVSLKDLKTLPFHPARKLTHKLVALHSVTFPDRMRYNMHRLLRAIDKNTLLSTLPPEEQADPSEMLPPRQVLEQAYSTYPHIIANTERLLASCSISFVYGKLANKNLKKYCDDETNDIAFLRAKCEEGLRYRYDDPDSVVLSRLETELDVIAKKDFATYYLINRDITQYAQRKGYYYVGRGSGANSLVAYLLRITDVDPIKLDLYFERFINIFRANAPDFDIDFSWTDRDDVTRYIFERFNNIHTKVNRTALLGAYNTFQHDAVIRELGKVYGLPGGEIERLQNAQRYPDIDATGKQILRYSERIRSFPSHLSVHASGIIISHQPIEYYSATIMPPKGFPTTQFSMLEAEDIGLFKFDILSQRGLGKIKDSLAIIKENKGVEIDIHQVRKFQEDEEVKELLRSGNAIGCFYVESPGMRMLLAKLKADDYLRLVAASSIIRPGVARSGMMREYITRFRDMKAREKARAQLPELYDILEETYGVMVYQEDVIKVAHMFGGLTLAEADYLRRGMSWKFKERNEFHVVKESFFNNCRKKGYAEQRITDIWNQIESFGNFAFSKGHSASYAVESYQALYLKAHFPLEYMVATLNNGGGFYRQEFYVHEARMHGAEIHTPHINLSRAECTIEGKVIYLGLAFINGMEAHTIQAIVEERNAGGPFKNMNEFLERVDVTIEQMRLLVRAGTFDFTGRDRKELLWEMHALLRPSDKKQDAKLFPVTAKAFKFPKLTTSPQEQAFEEMELFGFSLRSPFTLLRDPVPDGIRATDIKKYEGREVSIVGQLVNIKHTSTIHGQRMQFGTFIDQAGHWIDTVHFPPVARSHPFTGPGCYHIKGKVTIEYDFASIEVTYLKRLPLIDREALQEPPGATDYTN